MALLLLLTESLVVNSWLRYFKYVQLIFSSGSVILKYKSECIWETFPKYIHQEPSQTQGHMLKVPGDADVYPWVRFFCCRYSTAELFNKVAAGHKWLLKT